MINNYELEVELFGKIADGASKSELWQELKDRREELKHLVADGNPSLNTYREEITKACSSIRDQIERAPKIGPFAVAEVQLYRRKIGLAARVCRAVMEMQPSNLKDLDDIKADYQKLSANANEENLRECIAYLNSDDLTREVNELYGEVPTGEDLTQ